MKSFLRNAVIAGSVVVATTAGASPASATPGLLQFHGTATIDCFGCASTTGTASLVVTGVLGGNALVGAPATARFNAMYPPVILRQIDCLVVGVAHGSVSGAVDVEFNWTRLGAVAVITTTGEVTGVGTATLFVTSPAGVPCGQRVTATFAGAIGGV